VLTTASGTKGDAGAILYPGKLARSIACCTILKILPCSMYSLMYARLDPSKPPCRRGWPRKARLARANREALLNTPATRRGSRQTRPLVWYAGARKRGPDGVYQLGVFEYSAQGQGRSVITRGRDANARRRRCRHQKGVVQLKNWRGEVDAGPRRVGPHESRVARAGRQTRQHLRHRRMSDRHDLSPYPRRMHEPYREE